jgi:predicted transcriptional regulator
MRDQKTKPISVRLPADLVDSIERIAKRDFSTVTSIVGRALNLFVEKDRAAAEGYTAFLTNLERDAALDFLFQSVSEVMGPREVEIKAESQDLKESEEKKEG